MMARSLSALAVCAAAIAFSIPCARAQIIFGGGGGGGGTVSCAGAATTGYVATATSGGTNPPCSWQAVGSASVTNAAVTNAEFFGDTSVTANTITGTPSTAFPAYVPGVAFRIKVANTNTGAVTVNVNSLGAKSLVYENGNALGAGAVLAGGTYIVIYDGTNFVLQGLTGFGVTNAVARFTANGVLGVGTMVDTGAFVGIGTGGPDQLLTLSSASTSGTILHIINTNAGGFGAIRFRNDSGSDVFSLGLNGSGVGANPQISFSQPLVILPGGNDTSFRDTSGSGEIYRIYGTGGFAAAAISALSTPISGFGKFWFDTTAQTLEAVNAAGMLSTMVFPNACAGQVVQSISAAGIITCISASSGVAVQLNGTGLGTATTLNFTTGMNATFAGSTATISSTGGGTSNIPTVSSAGSSATLNIYPNCTSGTPCNFQQKGITITQVSAAQTATAPTSASNTAFIYATAAAACIVTAPDAVTVSAGCTYVAGTGFPVGVGAIPVATAQYAANVWTNITLLQPAFGAPENHIFNGGLTVASDDGSTQTITLDPTAASTGVGTQNFVPHWDSSGHNLVNGLIEDDGTNGVGVGGAASTASGFQERFSIISNSPPSNLLLNGIHSTSTGYTGEWEIYDYTGSAHAAFGLDSDHTTGFTYFSGIGPLGMQFATANGDYVFGARGTSPGLTPTFKIWGTGGTQTITKVFANFPTCDSAHEGGEGSISDAQTNTWGDLVTVGGGSNHIKMYCDGTNWTVAAQ